MRTAVTLLALALSGCATSTPAPNGITLEAELVIYGGTSAGVAAAVQGASCGLDVLLIEPTAHVGGLTTSGLGATDFGDKSAVGGVSREFYARIREHYADPEAWTREQPRASAGWRAGEDAMWRFEPHVAEMVFEAMLAEAGVAVLYGERIDLDDGVELRTGPDGPRIAALRLESGREVRGRMFIDAGYEGDLLALAGVPYTVGRESNAVYGETLNGVQTENAVKHQFVAPVDAYVVPGDPASGLVFGVSPGGPGAEGEGDRRVQAYCFRMCLTDDPDNRIPFERPADYDERRYELLLRHFEAGAEVLPWHSVGMPNRKTDTNNNRAFSTDFIGANYAYPEADHGARAAIVREHESYQRGLVWTLANHPRVPEAIRAEASRWGLAADEFVENGGWPYQIYVREARRMVGDYVMTEHDCMGRRRASDPVGMGAYNMDSHNVQRYVDGSGHARNEGDVQVSPGGPYSISYRSIVPPRGAATNLFVTCAMSASHIAYGSIRMEPVFMVLGHSAATAAALALELDVPVQAVPYDALRTRLLDEGQVLDNASRTARAQQPTGIDPASLDGIVVDEAQAERQGLWQRSTSVRPFVGAGYLHDGNDAKGAARLSFALPIEREGLYQLRLAYQGHPNRASSVPVTVHAVDGPVHVRVDQTAPGEIQDLWHALGTFQLAEGARVVVSNEETTGYVVVDAVQALPVSR